MMKPNTTYRSNLGELEPCCPSCGLCWRARYRHWFSSGFESKQGWVRIPAIRSLCKT